MWARIVNWKGGDAKNVEIDLLQEIKIETRTLKV